MTSICGIYLETRKFIFFYLYNYFDLLSNRNISLKYNKIIILLTIKIKFAAFDSL